MCFFSMYNSVLNTFSEYTYLYLSKTLVHTIFSLFLNRRKPSVSLKRKKRKLCYYNHHYWICLDMLYKQDPEHASGFKYSKILNMAKFRIWHFSQYPSVTQCSEYEGVCLNRVLSKSRVLNMPGFWLWQGSEYARVTKGSK